MSYQISTNTHVMTIFDILSYNQIASQLIKYKAPEQISLNNLKDIKLDSAEIPKLKS